MDIVAVIVNVLVFLGLAPLFDGIIRKLYAKVQNRQGPPIVQPYYDLLKLLGKERITPGNAAFKMAPVMAFASIVTVVTFVPLGFRVNALTQYADIITIIYILTLGGVSILLGALSSRNTYAMVGASREMITMIMVEPVLAMTLILGALKAKAMGISESMFSVGADGYGWGVALMLVVFLMALQAFVGRQPFDITEAEIEIIEGPFIEYSGPYLALYKYFMMIKQMFYSFLFVTVFMPFLQTGIYVVDIILQLVGILAVVVLIALVGSTNPRLRIEQAVRYYAVLILLSLTAVGLTVYGL